MPSEKSAIKYSKPLMEKRRRQRINASLMQLKTLVLDALDKNNPRHSKLEKADILEMTVRYLRMVRRQQISASVNMDPSKLDQYRSGYAECVNEVTRYVGATSATNGSPELSTQLVGHLANLCTETSQQQQQTSPVSATSPPYHQQTTDTRHYRQHSKPVPVCVEIELVNSPIPEGARPNYGMTNDVYNSEQDSHFYPDSHSNTAVKSPCLPTMPTGEIAVILPKQTLSNGELPTHFIPVYAEGPVVVSQSTDVIHQVMSLSPGDFNRSLSPSSVAVSPASSCTSPLTVTLSPDHSQQLNTELYASDQPVVKSGYVTPLSNDRIPKKATMWRPW